MTIIAIVGFCLLVFLLAIILPRLGGKVHRGGDRTLAAGQRTGGRAPGPIGKLFSRSFGTSRKAANKSHSAGNKTRGKLPF